MNESTKQAVEAILGNVNGTEEAGSPLAAVADWADRVRYYKPWSAPLHYIDVRDDWISGGCHYNQLDPKCRFDYKRDCPNDLCVAGAIVNYTSQLIESVSSSTKNIRTRRKTDGKDDVKEALMFLTQ